VAGTFSLSITTTSTTTSSFGESRASERAELAYLLRQAVAQIHSGRPSAPLIDRNGNAAGSYTYGAGMINAGA